jgi:hypothetical protein
MPDPGGTSTLVTAAAQKIGAMTSLIEGIASLTNLLALNATIEAARAATAPICLWYQRPKSPDKASP